MVLFPQCTSSSFALVVLLLGLLCNNVLSFSTPHTNHIMVPSSSTTTTMVTNTQLQMVPFFADEIKNENDDNKNSPSSSKKTTIVAGATGYIGKATVRESVRQGYNTIALVRDLKKVQSAEGELLYGQFFEGAKVIECDVCDAEALTKVCSHIIIIIIDVIIIYCSVFYTYLNHFNIIK